MSCDAVGEGHSAWRPYIAGAQDCSLHRERVTESCDTTTAHKARAKLP